MSYKLINGEEEQVSLLQKNGQINPEDDVFSEDEKEEYRIELGSLAKETSKKDKIKKPFPFKKLIAIARPEFCYLLFGTVSLFFASAAFLAIPYYVGGIIDTAISPDVDPDSARVNLILLIHIELFLISKIF